MFKQLLVAACLAVPVAAVAQDKMITQQSKMATCNKDAGAKNLKGDERKKFMSECLSAAKMSQQDKMKTCNKQAGEKKLAGDARKKFMSECLSA
ncbi:MAG: PsiF family protein [Burkholderiaceae bacterium]